MQYMIKTSFVAKKLGAIHYSSIYGTFKVNFSLPSHLQVLHFFKYDIEKKEKNR